jgi:Methane/Phenol/Toluene Hydroxylase.
VAETAFTNTLFVAMPAEAAANGDYLLPTVFHSVQSTSRGTSATATRRC